MEKLAKTCKILYDKDYLDSKKQLQENDIYTRVKYDSWKEYETLCEEFEAELPNVIREYGIDDWTYRDINYVDEYFGLRFSCDCEEYIEVLLTKLTKDKNKKWVEHMSNIIGSAIKGLAKSVSHMENLGEDIQDVFINREVCNIMITNMIKTLLFYSDDVQEGYELEKLRYFTCPKCKNDVDWLDTKDNDEIEMCFDCFEKI